MANIDPTTKQVRHTAQAKGGGQHEVTVGGPLTDKYYPHVNLNIWGEDDLGIELAPSEFFGWDEVPPNVNGKVVLSIPGVMDVEIYMLDESKVEFAAVLHQKPPGSKKSWKFDLTGWEGFDFDFQPDASQFPGATRILVDGVPTWTWDEGNLNHQRPERMCGGYCVYHKTKANHIPGQTNYATGKCWDIQRPLFIDNNGDEILGDIDITNGVMTISLPSPTWLNGAAYPVTIDPDFGYTTAGASNFGSNLAQCYATSATASGCTYTAGASEQVDTISSYCAASSGTISTDIGVYDVSSDVPSSKLCEGSITANTTAQWQTTGSVTTSMVNGTEYCTAFYTASNNIYRQFYDSSGTYTSRANNAGLPATWTHAASSNSKNSVYATYSVIAASASKTRLLISNVNRGGLR